MNLRALLPAFAQHLAATDAAPRTIASYVRTVDVFLRAVDGSVTASDIEAFLARESKRGGRLASSTKRGELMALRAFFRLAAREGAIADPTADIAIRGERRADPRFVLPAQVPQLFRAAASSREPERNLAIVGLFIVLGLRVHEVAQLRAEQVDLAAHMLWSVRGKGGTVVDLPVPPRLEALLAPWLRVRAMEGHGSEGPLFPTARPSASGTGQLSIRTLQRLVNRLSRDAGLGQVVGPHALRHGHGTASIAMANDIKTASSMMRHASIATTQIYVHLLGEDRRLGYERVSSLIPPDVLPGSFDAPPAEEPPPQNHAGSRRSAGGGGAVDIQPPMDDIRARSERDAPGSDTSSPPTTKHPALAGCLRSEKPESSRPDLPGGNREDLASIRELLAEHLYRVREAVDESLARLAFDLRAHGFGAELRSGHPARVALEPDDPRER